MTDLDTNPEQRVPSPGKIFIGRRQALGLTEEQVAKQLYMTVTKVKALENDDYGYLNSDTFIRGYIRAYANLLQINVEELLKEYDALIEQRTPKPLVEDAVVPVESSNKVAVFFIGVIAVFFLLVWLIDRWFFESRSEHSINDIRSSSVIAEETSQALVSTGSQLAVNSLAQHANGSVSDSSASVLSSTSASSQPLIEKLSDNNAVTNAGTQSLDQSSTSVSTAASSQTKSTSLDEISFQFSAESWLEVSDSRGDVLATELQPAGSKIKLSGRAPFDVKLGNAPSVTIELNGKKVEVIPLLGTNVLTLKVGQ